jgi:hypothetical protein
MPDGQKVHGKQTVQQILEIQLSEELGLIDEVSGTIRFNGGLSVPVEDGGALDSLLGILSGTRRRTSAQMDWSRSSEDS